VTKAIAHEVEAYARYVAEEYSRPERDNNFAAETYQVLRIVPLSEDVAAVVFDKSSGKQALALLFIAKKARRPGEANYWSHLFLTNSHILAFGGHIQDLYREVEAHNYPVNFDEFPKT
jgi:hypothetical protein